MAARKPAESLIWSRAVKVAAIKVKIKTARQLERLLADHGFSAPEAYELGVQEAQQEIVRRLSLVADKAWQKTNTADLKERPTQETSPVPPDSVQAAPNDPHEVYAKCHYCKADGVMRGFARTCCEAGAETDRKLGLPTLNR